MSLGCRINWHEWVYGEPFKVLIAYQARFNGVPVGDSSEGYEMWQRRTCADCKKSDERRID